MDKLGKKNNFFGADPSPKGMFNSETGQSVQWEKYLKFLDLALDGPEGKPLIKKADTETKRINKILKKFDIRPSQATDMDLTIVKKYGDIIDEDLMRQMLYDQDPQNLAEVMATLDESLIMQNDKGMGPQEIIEAFKESWKRKKNAKGGLSGVDQYLINRYQ